MIGPLYNKRWDRFWSWYFRRIIRKDFHRFEYDASFPIDPDKPLLVLANHFSWWDGWFIYRLNELLFKKRFHAMALEEMVQARPALRTLGVFSVKKGTRGVIESLDFANALLENPGNMLLMFPQGGIQSIHVAALPFEKGVCRIIREAKRPLQTIFSIALVDYASQRKPMVRFHFKEYVPDDDLENGLRAAFLEHYEQAKAVQTEKLYLPFP